ncbi:MAG: response regulator, partial [Candidatus Marinimicrobia bacterium]|nr:response regulator [Candidatus Neomarinimicrobiota bacterium]
EETDLYVGKEHILFVEDDDMVRDVTVRSLISMGYQVTEAENGVHALEKISESKEKFDLIITDLTMPKMNGRTLVKKVLSNCPEVKVIYCSGYSEEIAANDGLIEDDFPLLSKPFTILELTKTIRETMDGGNKKE